jgi:hypothetical protein
MDFLSDFIWGTAQEKAVGVVNQELKPENFINQDDDPKHPEDHILTKNSNCKESDKNQAYYELYEYLVKKEIINRKLNVFFFFSGLPTETINKELISKDILSNTTTLTKLIKINEIDEKTNLQCYNINYTNLSKFLTNYTYEVNQAADEYAVVGKIGKNGGKRNIKRKNKTKRKNRSRSSIKI